VERCFAQTGHLWEKYNMLDGSVNVQNEYDMPPMLGWTFGVYETFLKLLAK
jgi:alpha,alpha-trehalase